MARWTRRTRQRVQFVLASLLPIGTPLAGCGSDSSGPGGGPVSDSVLALSPVVSGLNTPIFLTAPAGDSRLFIAEKDGVIRIYKNGGLLPTPFLDITSLTTKGSEQGLLGMAFDPNYATNGRFYVSYTASGGGAGGHSVIARYHVSAGNVDVANPASDTTIITVDQPDNNHNGGGIAFGPDGMLYIGFGDGGGGGDTFGNGQNRTDLLGGMLRINVSGTTYTSPVSNPYATHPTFRHEIWNWGLRNPWRWSFDRQNGTLYIGDVGQFDYEEIDVQPASSTGGENYGWNTMEGLHCFEPASGCNKSGLTLPVLEYNHGGGGCAVVGGYVYRGSLVPAVQGLYFYSDNCSGFIRSFRYSGGQATEQKQWDALGLGGVYSFGEDGAGELYALTGSTVYRFEQPPAP